VNDKSTALTKPAATELIKTPKRKSTSRPASLGKKADVSPHGNPPTDEAIRLDAYLRWEAAGQPQGDGVDFWLQAENELRPTLAAGSRA
jgi:hypothetical protein